MRANRQRRVEGQPEKEKKRKTHERKEIKDGGNIRRVVAEGSA
jgi:hypothetical protein